MVLGFAGITVIICRGDVAALTGLSFGVGDLILWCGVICYAFYSAYLPRVPGALGLLPMMTVMFAMADLLGD